MLKKIALAAGLAIAAVAPASADVIYGFTTTSFGYNGPAGEITPFPGNTRPGLPVGFTFRLRDEVVDAGSFFYSTRIGVAPNPDPSPQGDVNGFVTLSVPGATIVPGSAPAAISVALTFSAIGAVTSSVVQFFGFTDQAFISGFGSTASGFVGSDNPACNASVLDQRCSVSGVWTFARVPDAPSVVVPVPEPASLALFGMGLLGLGFARRKRAA